MKESVFSNIPESAWLHQSNHFFIIPDKYPVSNGHLLIISKLHRLDFFELTDEEQKELPELITKAKTIIEQSHTPTGYNIGMNCGASAGQTVFHFHCHVIPRYEGDMADPRGGVRHSVEGKGYY
ncbi:MAG: HIT family protein [Balneolaceae bacterium]|nr:HIT family protein [Balneolaceae bacterium]MCH8549859.1 HIT family protein [Balneolaceae bacterium]